MARVPNLIHPVEAEFELMDRADSVFDEYAREPVGQVVRDGESPNTPSSGSRVTIRAQISFYFSGAKQDYPMYERGGTNEVTDMYISVRYVDLLKAGLISKDTNGNYVNFLIKRGDRMIRYGKTYCDLYVAGFKPFGFYPKHGQTMLQINFTDRHPGYQEGDL